ncbi:MAG: FAD-binding protein [Woeseiaceae bacterium]|nr:FAD-binding protein [Woeseiaceae bacterium]
MKRRTFVKSAIAVGASAVLPGCNQSRPLAGGTLEAVTGSGEEVSIESAAVKEFAGELSGNLYLPTDQGYDTARQVWNAMIDKKPALIAQCASVDDIKHCVEFARHRELLVAVKGGGHSYPGKSTCNGGMMIDVSQLHAVDIDADNRVATVQGGALLGHLDTASIKQNLATTTGIVSHTGVGGFTLGGGMGRLDRMHGLAIDNLLGATVITADGRTVRASEDENPDLFWALRGGGGNFGIVTEFVYRLHPFDDTVYGGFLEYPIDKAKEMMTFFAEFEQSMPNEARVEPYLYADDGERIFGFSVLYAGDPATGETVFAPLVAAGTPIFNSLDVGSYSEIQTMLDGELGHGQLNYLKSGFIVELTPEFIDAFVDNFEGDPTPNVWFQHLGGTTSQVGGDATAYAHRDVRFNLGIDSVFTDASETEARIAAVRRYYAAMAPFMKGYYTNLNDEGAQKTWGNYGPNYPRLAKVKAEYDPSNLFRLNANIEPAA